MTWGLLAQLLSDAQRQRLISAWLVLDDFTDGGPRFSKLGKYVGICGQGPSDHPDVAEWLMDEGIQTISLNPDTVVDTWLRLAKHAANA